MSTIFSNDYKAISRLSEYKSSDYIFLGEVLETYSTHFDVKVIEVFKGVMNDTFRVIIDANSVSPKKGEIWLLYSNTHKGNNHIYQNGWSRSFSWPFNTNSEMFPEPPPDGMNEAFLSYINKYYLDMALLELHYDIICLRQIKMQKELEEIKNIYTKIEEKQNNKTLIKNIRFFKWSCLVIFLLIVIVAIKVFLK